MVFETTDYYKKLEEFEKSSDPRGELCKWLNRMSSQEKVFFIRWIAGWQTAHYYSNHTFSTTGDQVFDELVSFVLPNIYYVDMPLRPYCCGVNFFPPQQFYLILI